MASNTQADHATVIPAAIGVTGFSNATQKYICMVNFHMHWLTMMKTRTAIKLHQFNNPTNMSQ